MTRKKISYIIAVFIGLSSLGIVGSISLPPAIAHAQTCTSKDQTFDPTDPQPTPCIGQGGVDANGQVTCTQKANSCSTDTAAQGKSKQVKFITDYANPVINFLAGAVGLIATINIVIGGIQYAASADDPGAVSKAKGRILNTVLGLLAFLFLYSFLEWVTPGGFLHS